MNPTLHALLPKKLLSATMYRVARIEQQHVKNMIIRLFMRITGANLTDATRQHINEYSSLLDFFTRELNQESRPISLDDNSIAAPVDGTVAHVGNIENDLIFQIKGYGYSLENLVSSELAKTYQNGQATTIYLAPYDYHRIHAPLAGTLKHAKYIPGELNSVSITLLDKIAGLFAKNERVVLEFETENGSPYLMVLVGAVNVGSIETVFHGEICPNGYDAPITLPTKDETIKKGDEIGRFNLGSTIIFITPDKNISWEIVDHQKTLVGEKIGQLINS